jgi:hypothetical protein
MRAINLGAGAVRMENVESHDINKDFACDHDFDLRVVPWPLANDTYDEVYLFHAIEHIEKVFHKNIYQEIWRILKPDTGTFIMSFPEFEIIAGYWIDNHRGERKFWENTIYGLQRTPSDYHLCAMDSQDTVEIFKRHGFKNIAVRAEMIHEYNTVFHAMKGVKPKTYEEVVYEEVIKG